MELNSHKPRVVCKFNNFYQSFIRRNTCDFQTAFGKLCSECVIEFPAVAVAFINKGVIVNRSALGDGRKLAWVKSQTHCAALFSDILLVVHDVDDTVRNVRYKFS